MVGRYLRMDIEGIAHRSISKRRTGHPIGLPAHRGADSRQYRHLLADSEITKRFRVLAFDMPWHGKSTPPDGWERGEYRLTTRAYNRGHPRLLPRLELYLPVVMGCSIGGRIVLNLAIEPRQRVPRLIALEAPTSSNHGTTRRGCTGPTCMAATCAPLWSPA